MEATTEKQSGRKLAMAGFFVILLICAIAARFIKFPAFSENSAKKYDVSTEGNFWIGVSQPQVTIIEFCDFYCSACKNSAATLKTLRKLYPGKLKIVFKNLCADDFCSLALAVHCAGEQGLFWPMHDQLFAEQGNFSLDELPELAAAVGTNQARWQRCFSGEYYKEQITADNSEATKLKVSGTPTFFVNGYKISGDIPLDNWKQIIDKFLQP